VDADWLPALVHILPSTRDTMYSSIWTCHTLLIINGLPVTQNTCRVLCTASSNPTLHKYMKAKLSINYPNIITVQISWDCMEEATVNTLSVTEQLAVFKVQHSLEPPSQYVAKQGTVKSHDSLLSLSIPRIWSHSHCQTFTLLNHLGNDCMSLSRNTNVRHSMAKMLLRQAEPLQSSHSGIHSFSDLSIILALHLILITN
jgi:hypothetical protein